MKDSIDKGHQQTWLIHYAVKQLNMQGLMLAQGLIPLC